MNEFDFKEFTKLVNNVERLGADMNKVSKSVLDAGSTPAKQAFTRKLPYDTTTPSSKRKHKHARDNVTISRTKTSKKGSKYKVIGAKDKIYNYLWYLEKDTTYIKGRQFRDIAVNAARKSAAEPMKQALLKELEKYI